MEFLANFFGQFAEFRNLGANAGTVTFAGTVLFSLWGARGLWKQVHKVEAEGGDAVSVIWQMTLMTLFVSFAIYGYEQMRFALLLQAVCRAPLYFIMLIVLWRYKRFDAKQWTLFISLTVLLALLSWHNKGFAMIVFNYLGAGFAATQPWKIWRLRKTNGVDPELTVIYLLSGIFWLGYGWATDDSNIVWTMVASCIVHTTTLALYSTYRGVTHAAT